MSRKRRPFVAVETDVAKDESFAVLADICGYGRDEAIGRIVRLWAWCADRKLHDAPEDCAGYAVPRGVVQRFLGPRGIDGILGGGVAEFALGSEFRDGLIYLRGTDITVASMRARSAGSVTGGQTRAREILATSSRGTNGKFVAQLTIDQRERGETTTVHPPSTTVDPRSQIPDPRSGSESSSSHGPGRDPASSAERGDVVTGVTTLFPSRTGRMPARGKPSDPTPAESASITTVLAKLSAVSGIQLRGAQAHVRLILARLREGITELELRAVVAYCGEEWKNDPKMQRYLRPETLFGPETIARYLDPARTLYRDRMAEAARDEGKPIPQMQHNLEIVR